MTDAEYTEWLINPANDRYRVLLFEIHHSTGSVCLATQEYNKTKPFGAFIIDVPMFSTRIDAPVSIGSLKAIDALKENWADYQFAGFTTDRYFGDTRWELSKFKKTGTLLNQSINYENEFVYSFEFSDAGKLLDVPVQSELWDDSGERKLMPMGDCKLIKPQVTDSFNLVYWYGLNVTLTKLYDMGLDITAHIDIDTPSAGYFKFKSGHNPAGELRFDCVSNNTVQQIAQKVADDHNISISFAGFGSDQARAIGVLASDYSSISALFNDLAITSGTVYRVTSDNKVEFVVPGTQNSVEIRKDETIADLSKSGEIPAVKRVIVKYGRNINPYSESELATSLTQEQKEALTASEKSITESTGANTGTLDEERVFNTLLSNQADAQAKVNTLKVKYSQKHTLWKTKIKILHNLFKVGDSVNFFEYGRLAFIRSIDENGIDYTADIEVQSV